jgi:hypothetical protein
MDLSQREISLTTKLSEAENEIERLRAGLNIIAQAGTLHGAAWCVAQAIGYRDNLDFNEFPETGKPTYRR